jgi:hypothetical protein
VQVCLVQFFQLFWEPTSKCFLKSRHRKSWTLSTWTNQSLVRLLECLYVWLPKRISQC